MNIKQALNFFKSFSNSMSTMHANTYIHRFEIWQLQLMPNQ